MKVNRCKCYKIITEQKCSKFKFKFYRYLKNQNITENISTSLHIKIKSIFKFAFFHIKKYIKFFILHFGNKFKIGYYFKFSD